MPTPTTTCTHSHTRWTVDWRMFFPALVVTFVPLLPVTLLLTPVTHDTTPTHTPGGGGAVVQGTHRSVRRQGVIAVCASRRRDRAGLVCRVDGRWPHCDARLVAAGGDKPVFAGVQVFHHDTCYSVPMCARARGTNGSHGGHRCWSAPRRTHQGWRCNRGTEQGTALCTPHFVAHTPHHTRPRVVPRTLLPPGTQRLTPCRRLNSLRPT